MKKTILLYCIVFILVFVLAGCSKSMAIISTESTQEQNMSAESSVNVTITEDTTEQKNNSSADPVTLEDMMFHLELLNSCYLENYGAQVDWTRAYYRVYENENSFNNGEAPIRIELPSSEQNSLNRFDPLGLQLFEVENFSTLAEWQEYLYQYMAPELADSFIQSGSGEFYTYDDVMYLGRGSRGYGYSSLNLDTAILISNEGNTCSVVVNSNFFDSYQSTIKVDFEWVNERWIICRYGEYKKEQNPNQSTEGIFPESDPISLHKLTEYTWFLEGYRLSDTWYFDFFQTGSFIATHATGATPTHGTYTLKDTTLTLFYNDGQLYGEFLYDEEKTSFISTTWKKLVETDYVDEKGVYHEPVYEYRTLVPQLPIPEIPETGPTEEVAQPVIEPISTDISEQIQQIRTWYRAIVSDSSLVATTFADAATVYQKDDKIVSVVEYRQLNDAVDPALATVHFYYHDGKPFFVFIEYENAEYDEVRIYFSEGKLIRWIIDQNAPQDNKRNTQWENYYNEGIMALENAWQALE